MSNRRNKKTDSHKDKMLSLATVLAILEIANTILEIFVNVNIKMYKSDKIKMYNYSKLT